jgi:hypothetical protein
MRYPQPHGLDPARFPALSALHARSVLGERTDALSSSPAPASPISPDPDGSELPASRSSGEASFTHQESSR